MPLPYPYGAQSDTWTTPYETSTIAYGGSQRNLGTSNRTVASHLSASASLTARKFKYILKKIFTKTYFCQPMEK